MGNGNLLVSGPSGFSQLAQLVSISSPSDSPTLTATYSITSSGWDFTRNGSYQVHLQDQQITDSLGHAAPAADLGSLAITILPTDLHGQPLLLTGTDGPDTIGLSAANDLLTVRINGNSNQYQLSSLSSIRIDGLAGDDSITVGQDILGCTIFGGAGNDTIYGGQSKDWISGGAGNDCLFGGNGGDTIYGDDGFDYIGAGKGLDSVNGGNQGDTILGAPRRRHPRRRQRPRLHRWRSRQRLPHRRDGQRHPHRLRWQRHLPRPRLLPRQHHRRQRK